MEQLLGKARNQFAGSLRVTLSDNENYLWPRMGGRGRFGRRKWKDHGSGGSRSRRRWRDLTRSLSRDATEYHCTDENDAVNRNATISDHGVLLQKQTANSAQNMTACFDALELSRFRGAV
jgi:hypothetical protein